MQIIRADDREVLAVHRRRRHALTLGLPFLVAGAVATAGGTFTVAGGGPVGYGVVILLIGLPCLGLGLARATWRAGVEIDRRRGRVRSWSSRLGRSHATETPLDRFTGVALIRYWHFGKQQQNHLFRAALRKDDGDVVLDERLDEPAARAGVETVATFTGLPAIEEKGRAETL